MTTPVFKLTKGARYLDLQSGRYNVYPGWAPPPVSEVPLFAEGTSANRSGAVLVDRRPVNRQMSLRVNVRGSSDAEIRRGVADLQSMLSQAGDESEPLYLEFRPNSDTPEPLWGNYGVNLHYEIVHGVTQIADSYGRGNRLATSADVVLSLTIKPYAIGRAQRLASALGGILEDTLGATDGASRGLIIPEGTTNKATNPVFGHATWNNGWTTGSELISEQNTNPAYVLFGLVSARVTCKTTGSRVFYQSLNVGNTNTHAFSLYAKRPDSAAVTSADCQIYYNTSLTTTFTAIGDGWYRLTASAAGINASTITGVIVAAGAEVYVDGLQVEELNFSTPLVYGDMLGCSWTGTVHASTSTRPVGRARLTIAADTFNIGAGCIRVVWRAPYANTHGGSNLFMWSCGSATLRAYYQLSDDKFYFTDGTTSISTAAQTFAAGDVITLHFVWGLGAGLIIYKNGASAASNGVYTPPAVPTYIYIGSSDTPNAQGYGPFMDFAVFDQALTVAQVLADYTNIVQLTGDGQRVGAIPWLWTKDGDDVVDNCDDSTRDNWVVCGGVPGSVDALTRWEITPSVVSKAGYWLLRAPADYGLWRIPNSGSNSGIWYGEHQGTADANASGGEYDSTAVATVEPSWATLTLTNPALMTGQIHMFARFKDSASSRSVTFVPWFQHASGERTFAYQGARVGSIDTSYRWFYCGSIFTNQPVAIAKRLWQMTLGVQISISSGSFTTHLDYIMAINGEALLISAPASGGTGWAKIVLKDTEANAVESDDQPYAYMALRGSPAHLAPALANMVWFVVAGDGDTHTITDTGTFTRVDVSPRYALL